MAWGRLLECIICENTDQASATGLVVSDLHMDFKVERSVYLDKPSRAEVTIYNAAPSTREYISKPGMNLLLSAGYADQDSGALRSIFVGNITTGGVTHVKAGPTWETKIVATMMRNTKEIANAAMMAISLGDNASLGSIARSIATAMGLNIIGAEQADSIKLPHGWAFFGRAHIALQQLRQRLESSQLSLYVDMNTLYIYNPKAPTKSYVISLGFNSGLLHLQRVLNQQEKATPLKQTKGKRKKPQDTELRYKFECLLSAMVQPNSPVYFDSTTNDAEGAYLIESIVHEGDNYAKGKWTTSGEAFK